MMENRRLRVFGSISVGMHLLLICTATFLFSGTELRQTPIHHVKVVLYPREEEEKSVSKIVRPVPVKTQIAKPAHREPVREEKEMEVVLRKEDTPPVPLPVQVTKRDIPPEEPRRVRLHGEEEKIIEEPAHRKVDTTFDRISNIKKEEGLSAPLRGDGDSEHSSGKVVAAGIGQGDSPVEVPDHASGTGRKGVYWRGSEEGGGGGQGGFHEGGSGNGLGMASGLSLGAGAGKLGSHEGGSGNGWGTGSGIISGLGSGSGLGAGSREKDSPQGNSQKGLGVLGKLFSSPGGKGGAYPGYAQNPKPSYPEEARKKGLEGEVLLRVEVLADGRAGRLELKKSSGHEILDRSAMTTVKEWKFTPANSGNGSVSSWVNIPIRFRLK